ncbi:hypothetical protein [Streptomyces sp. NBC_01429]|uniref:hypothetical protein n=1 Tax=Streptomyces sp. NBC_01429 TaxID=2903862 RepID=UPI002E295253|nr:hypothetical protein [Streptomyces sp. NBC_01429]
MTEPVGWFHFDPPAGDLAGGTPHWRVTTDDPEVARNVSRILGGKFQKKEAPFIGQLEVRTESATVDIIVESVTDTIAFRLASFTDLGSFGIYFRAWKLREVMGDVEEEFGRIGGMGRGLLTVEPMDVVALNGMILRYARPMLTVFPT